MALTVLRSNPRQAHTGNGYSEIDGIAAFSTTDATGELPVPFASVEEIQITPIGAVATDESLYVDEAAQVNGGILQRPASGTLTITRTGAAKTSGLMFAFRARGH